MIERLKSKRAKDGREKRKKSLSAEAKDGKNDVDILQTVREINLNGLDMSDRFESSNGHEHCPTKKAKLDQEHQKGKRVEISGAASVSVPKLNRTLSAHTAFKISRSVSKVPSKDSRDDWHEVKGSSFQYTEMDMDSSHDSKDKRSKHKILNENNEDDW